MRAKRPKTRGKRASSRRVAARRPARKTAAKQQDGAVEALVAGWPGPAAILARDGSIIRANKAADAVLSELSARTRDTGGLADVVAAVLAGRAARTDTVAVAARAAPQTFDLCLQPLSVRGMDVVLLLGRDVSLPANLRHALAESRQRFKDLVEISSDFAWETDAKGAFTFVSPQGPWAGRQMSCSADRPPR
jgi:PAS domain-containing protein